MKKFHSYSDFETTLKQRNIPYEDHKEDILENLKTPKNNALNITRKAIILCASVLLFISIATVAIATKGFGLIPSQESFIKDTNGEITTAIKDTEGNYVSQFGTCPTDENRDKELEELQKIQSELHKEYKPIKESLQASLPDDKLGIIIPVKDLDSLFTAYFLNNIETYDSKEDMSNNIINAPFPKYLPPNYELSTIKVRYTRSTIDDLTEIFVKTKAEGKDYYYEECDRIPTSFTLTFYNGSSKLCIEYKKGESSRLTSSDNHMPELEKFSHNNREYVCNENCTYFSYFYTSEQLWTINLETTDRYTNRVITDHVTREEIIKIVESMSHLVP